MDSLRHSDSGNIRVFKPVSYTHLLAPGRQTDMLTGFSRFVALLPYRWRSVIT